MRLYHGTTLANARIIAEGGFEDVTSNFGLFSTDGTPVNTTGVFFSDLVLDENEGVCSEGYLLIDVPEATLEGYEWLEEGKGYREWCLPARLANEFFEDRKIYSWDEAQEVSANLRAFQRGQTGEGFSSAIGGGGEELSPAARGRLDQLLLELLDLTQIVSPEEMANNWSWDYRKEMEPRLAELLKWLGGLADS